MTTWYGCTEALKTPPAATSSPNSDRIGKGIPGGTIQERGADRVIVLQTNLLLLNRQKIGAPASDMRLSTLYGYREDVVAGGLTSYGVDLRWC